VPGGRPPPPPLAAIGPPVPRGWLFVGPLPAPAGLLLLLLLLLLAAVPVELAVVEPVLAKDVIDVVCAEFGVHGG
jgi:hypothetical protein